MTSRIIRIFTSFVIGFVVVVAYLVATFVVVFNSDPSSRWLDILRWPLEIQRWVYTYWIAPLFFDIPVTEQPYFQNIGNFFSVVTLWLFISIAIYIGVTSLISRWKHQLK